MSTLRKGLPMDEEAIALEAYERIAEWFAARAGAKAHNALYERPAMLSLLPPVDGMRVLDAGCGPGIYAEWLAEHGAQVTACDVSPKMVAFARQRLGARACVLQADFGRPLDFAATSSFDLVLSALALDHVRDWGAAFAEFFRVLRPGGLLVFSAGHPFDEFYDHHNTGNYFAVERVEFTWQGGGEPVQMPYYRRPLGAMLDPLPAAGFVLERLLEPRPVEAFREQEPEDYEKLMRQPGFICIRARKALSG
jgi:SAM-dependent methyltransferase